MANHILVNIYGENLNPYTGLNIMSFPTSLILFKELSPPVTMNEVDTNSIIKVLGTNNSFETSQEFYTDSTVNELTTLSNA